MIEDYWPRICGMHVQPNGNVGCVWMAHDKDRDLVHVFDACIFRSEVLAVIAEGLNARGRYVPVAWAHKEFSASLLDRGVNMLPESVEASQASAEVATQELIERMRTHRFKVERRLQVWVDEYQSFERENQQVPTDTHPLMSATRYAVQCLPYARRVRAKSAARQMFPRVAIV